MRVHSSQTCVHWRADFIGPLHFAKLSREDLRAENAHSLSVLAQPRSAEARSLPIDRRFGRGGVLQFIAQSSAMAAFSVNSESYCYTLPKHSQKMFETPERMKDTADGNTMKYRTPSGLEVTKLQPVIGAEISGTDLARDISPAAATDIRNALLAHGVVFFRKQKLAYESHLAFARLFGEAMTEIKNSGRPEVLEVRSRGGSREGTASTWHSDGCYMKIPPAISILRSLVVPPLGGDTCFSSAVAAYRDLSDEMKRCMAPLRYTSSGVFMFGRGTNRFFDKEEWARRLAEYPEVTHPVVRVHPETGAPLIYTNEAQTMNIVGMDNEVGRTLLRYLADQMRKPEYQVRWRWESDAIAVWDNRAVQHYGVPDQIAERHMERIMVAGTSTLSIADWEAMAKK